MDVTQNQLTPGNGTLDLDVSAGDNFYPGGINACVTENCQKPPFARPPERPGRLQIVETLCLEELAI